MGKQQKSEKIAIQWLAHLNSPELTQEQQDNFFEWLNSSPENQCAYLKAEKLWSQASVISKVQYKETLYHRWLSYRPALAIACSFAFILLFSTFYFNRPDATQEFHTAIGEQQEYQLKDGSTILLNTNSLVKIEFTQNNRLSYVDKGEVFFKIQKDEARPFDVITPNGSVRVVGTQFSVHNKGQDSIVTVIEGKVALGSQTVLPDQSISMNAAALGETPVKVDAAAELSWRKKQLVYRNQALEQVIEDLNRYFEEDISLGDPSLKSKEVVAVIQLESVETTTAVLARSLNLKVKIDREKRSVIFTSPANP